MAAETFRIEIPVHVEDKTEPGVSKASEKMSKFDKQNEKTQKRLEKMNSSSYKLTLSALDKASAVIGTVYSKAKSLASKAFRISMTVLDKATAPLRSILKFATSIQGALLGASGALAVFYQPMSISADYEQTQIAFETMLKSADKAKQFLKEATAFANKTPFEFPELINSSKLLLAFGFQGNQILDMMQSIGDASSALGGGSEGIESISRALGQIKAKGRPMAQEMLQLTEAGVPANQILQEELGLTADQVANIGKESITADTAINALLKGMDKRYGGLMQKQATTAKGMLSTIKDTIKNVLLRNWGEGLWEGVKPWLSNITTWLTDNSGNVEKWGEAWKKAGSNLSKWVGDKINVVRKNIKELTASQEWKNASSFSEKAKLAWNKIIAEPFEEWWNGTGKTWLSEKASNIGSGIGSGITTGLLAILGIDLTGAENDGKSIGASFINGFKKGFDMDKVSEAIKEWAGDHKGIIAAAGTAAGIKFAITFLPPIVKAIGKASKLIKKIKGSNDSGTSSATKTTGTTCSTMNVNANIVNVYGKSVNNSSASGNGSSNVSKNLSPLIGGGSAIGSEKLLTSGLGKSVVTSAPLLTGGSATGSAAAGGLTSSGSWLSKLLMLGSKSSVIGADGTLIAVQGGLGGTLGSFAGALGSGASTAGGAAAAGVGAAGGIIGGALGLGSAAVDLYKGSKASKAGDKKTAKEKYITSGTKAGMVATGAGIGAAVGSVVPVVGTGIGAAVGAGIGGAAALFGGKKAGKAISDNSGKMKNFFTKTIPEGWDNFWDGAGSFFTESIPGWWSGLNKKTSKFFTETIPEKWDELWKGIGDFLVEDVPYAIGYACGKVEIFFTEDIPKAFTDLWGGIATFFTDTLPTWASNIWNGEIVPFFTEDIPEFFTDLWENISTFFTDTLPTWASDTWNNDIVPFFTQDIPSFFISLWGGISTFFTETIPTWSSNIWNNNVVPFFTKTIPGFLGSIWNGVTAFFTESIPAIASNIWSSISGWFNSIREWISTVWQKVKSSFSSGYGDATTKGGGNTKHAWGGIMTTPHVGTVAEEGAESIIPLSPSKKSRGFDLWMKTGRLLGVKPYADGGIVGQTEEIKPISRSIGNVIKNNFNIRIELNPEFVISGDNLDEESIIAIIKARIKEMVDDIGDELAERLARIFANMPIKGVS